MRRRLRRTEDLEPRGTKSVDDARGERRFRSDDRERDLVVARELDEIGNRGQRDIGERRIARRAAIARRDEHARDARALRDLPRQRVLAATAADDEDVHVDPLMSVRRVLRRRYAPLLSRPSAARQHEGQR